jgi:hypothetical protein
MWISPSIARVGLDFRAGGGHGLVWGTFPLLLAWPGPNGPEPTVRLMLTRQGLQDFEVRLAVLEVLAKLPADRQRPYRDLLDRICRRVILGGVHGCVVGLSQAELSLDFPGYVAEIYRAAEELTGVKTEARWDNPPR